MIVGRSARGETAGSEPFIRAALVGLILGLFLGLFLVLTMGSRAALADQASPGVGPGVGPGDGAAELPLSLGYKIYAGGLHAFSFDAEVALAPAHYEMALDLRTDGWLDWIWSFSIMAQALGSAGPQGLSPQRFRTESLWRDQRRWVEISYDAAGRPTAEVDPPPEEDERDPVPEAERVGTLDPISAALALVDRLMRTQRCGGEVKIFDGRRSFEASAAHLGEQSLTASDIAPYGGAATACRLSVRPSKGFWKNPDYPPEPQEVTVYLRAVVPDGPPLPVRIEADTRFGGVRAHLISAEPAGSAQKAAR